MSAEEIRRAPENYNCPFCRYISGGYDDLNAATDLISTTDHAFAPISPKWWPRNRGHVIVAPVEHFENLYVLPSAVGHAAFDLTRTVAVAMREAYGCSGISTRQHNEPAGNQDVWHHHVHVFPRYRNDQLYIRHREAAYVSAEERAPFGALLRARLAASAISSKDPCLKVDVRHRNPEL